jgi:hypothetical protein
MTRITIKVTGPPLVYICSFILRAHAKRSKFMPIPDSSRRPMRPLAHSCKSGGEGDTAEGIREKLPAQRRRMLGVERLLGSWFRCCRRPSSFRAICSLPALFATPQGSSSPRENRNCIPASSSARLIALRLLAIGTRRPASKSRSVLFDIWALAANSSWDQFSQARAALHCSGDISEM